MQIILCQDRPRSTMHHVSMKVLRILLEILQHDGCGAFDLWTENLGNSRLSKCSNNLHRLLYPLHILVCVLTNFWDSRCHNPTSNLWKHPFRIAPTFKGWCRLVVLFFLFSMTRLGYTKSVVLSRCCLRINMINGVKLSYYRKNTKTKVIWAQKYIQRV